MPVAQANLKSVCLFIETGPLLPIFHPRPEFPSRDLLPLCPRENNNKNNYHLLNTLSYHEVNPYKNPTK